MLFVSTVYDELDSHEHSGSYVTKDRVFVRDGPSYGHEMSKSGWKQVLALE